MKINSLGSLFLVSMVIVFPSFSQTPAIGTWRGNIHYEQQILPFTFTISEKDKHLIITLVNGKEELIIENAEINGDSIYIPMHVFDTSIRARFTANSMTGEWVKHFKPWSVPFTAEINEPRFNLESQEKLAVVEPRLDITFMTPSGYEIPGIGLFEQNGNMVTGTVLTEVGDYRFFEGVVDGDSIKLTTFDGAHAFMLMGKKTEGKWEGVFHQDDGYQESWTAYADPDVELQDPLDMIRIKKGKSEPYFDILGAGSGPNAIDPKKYEGKVVLIQLFGTWCPNSYDQTKYLVSWKENNSDKEVEILAVSFEANYSKEYGLARIGDYKKKMDITYDVVLGGRLSKQQAALAFPFMDRIKAFPTLVILDKKGQTRYVHSYFNGPATGPYYEQFDRRFNEIIESLLAE